MWQRIIFVAAVLVLIAGAVYYFSAFRQPAAGPAGTPPPASVAEPGPTRITAEDKGKVFTYRPTERFSVVLDATRYPREFLACSPGGVIGAIASIPDVEPPLIASSFEAVKPGACILSNGDFTVTINVTGES